MPDNDTATIEAPQQSAQDIPREVIPEWTPPARDADTPAHDALAGERNVLGELLGKLPDADATDADNRTDVNPDAATTPEPAKAADSTDGTPADDPFAGLEGLDAEEKTLVFEKFREFLESQGKATTAPVQPDPAVAAEVQASADAPAEAPAQPTAPASPFYKPLSDEDLLDAKTVNQHFAGRDAALESRFRQWHSQEFIPQAGAILEQGMITLAVLRENPLLEDSMEELSSIVGKTLSQNPDMGFNKAIDECAKEAMRSLKTSQAIEKAIGKGKIDARTGDAPQGLPRGGVERDPASGRFTNQEPKLSPLAQLAYDMARNQRR